MAVGEIPPLMEQASNNLNKLFYELVAICEVFRYRVLWILRRSDMNDAIAYTYQDLQKKPSNTPFGQWLINQCSCFLCATDDNDDDDA